MTDEQGRPAWAERLRTERLARGWSQADAVAAMRTFSDVPLAEGLLDQWKRWERGRNKPDEFYRPVIAATIGTVVDSIFTGARPVRQRTTDEVLVVRSGMDTHELVQPPGLRRCRSGPKRATRQLSGERTRCARGSR